MTIKLGINGLGRIGRCVIRAWAESGRDDVEIVAVNFRRNTPEKVHLLKYDSIHGTYKGDVHQDGDDIMFGDKRLKVFHNDNPADIPWGDAGVDVVLECTGVFKSKEQALLHTKGGAKKILISSPAPDPDATVVFGVNNHVVTADSQVISVGSCTTNCLAPMAKALNDAIGIDSGYMTTIHAFTGDQNLVDGNHRDLRRGRAATLSMVPASTGAAKALALVLPELKGKIDGTAMRVPTANVSFVDLTFNAAKDVTVESVNAAVEAAANGAMKGVLAVNHEPLVSIDFNGNPHSSIFDATQTAVLGDRLVRVAAWYDNEWGFSNRMLDVATLVG